MCESYFKESKMSLIGDPCQMEHNIKLWYCYSRNKWLLQTLQTDNKLIMVIGYCKNRSVRICDKHLFHNSNFMFMLKRAGWSCWYVSSRHSTCWFPTAVASFIINKLFHHCHVHRSVQSTLNGLNMFHSILKCLWTVNIFRPLCISIYSTWYHHKYVLFIIT